MSLLSERDSRDLDAGSELQLESRDRGPDGVADERRLDAVGCERVDELLARGFGQCSVELLVTGALQQRERRQTPSCSER